MSGWTSGPRKTLRARTIGAIADVDPESTPGYDGDKKSGAHDLAEIGETLSALQEQLYAEGRSGGDRSVLVVLQGMDTAGKGGIVRHVGGLMDPQGLTVTGFGKPTQAESEHDFLWRIRNALPAPGRIGIFDRSHYEDVLPVRVHELVPESVWRGRYDEINAFEAELAASGTSIVKCALVVSKAEQKSRLAERLERPDKFWKYDPNDLAERALWDEYLEAYQEVFDRTDTDAAPWHLIPADRKWFARLAVARLLVETLESLDLSWPPADFDVEAQKKRVAALAD
ncbi:polyphosphate kinase 2 family protein [Gordonia sp. HY002]|uniref:polyphosphate kinase 2 family protein n=1 Tax=Gordonia zhenghanii TaxID=2911516 RepID=UPI001EF00891|nr:polyphosphate kinase 2 family protein [Gordonia zhenghanii]MCF8569044.1 polyphosphate kinase 2 family protein [Gordonia zhenghanii]MCF8605246.1 polyphosphate kinase 2 family protein [Gordonia zhenghanii]